MVAEELLLVVEGDHVMTFAGVGARAIDKLEQLFDFVLGWGRTFAGDVNGF